MRRTGGQVVVAALVAAAVVAARATPADATLPDVVISEFMASNSSAFLDEDGEASDWIELWNRSSSPVNLAGWHLTDSAAALGKWTFPAVSLPADGRLVVVASDKDELHPLHTNFRLSAGGEYLALTDPDATVVDEFAPTFPPQTNNVAYGLGSNDVVGYLLTATPGAPNDLAGAGVAATPTLSHSGGWLEGPVQVTAATTTPGATLVYTLDGSLPTAAHGTTYTGPIDVAGTTLLRVVAVLPGWFPSRPASATFLDLDEVLAQEGVPAGWPAAPVNGQVFDYGFDQAFVATHRNDVAAALQAAPVVSVLTDQDHLTDPTTGIYVNPLQSGSAWERPASVDFMDGDDGFHLPAGVRLKGGFSRTPTNPKHSLRLTFGPQYGGLLTYPLFGEDGIQTFGEVDLRSEQNYAWHFGHPWNTFLRDVWLRDTQAATGSPATRSRWAHVFLNGQYWGLYMLAERAGDTMAAQTWGGTPGDYDVLKHGDGYGYEVDDGDDDEWLQLWAAIEDVAVTDEEYAAIAAAVDLQNLADSRLVDLAAGNNDSAPSYFLLEERANNWFAVGSADEPFRFVLHDGEHTLGAWNHDVAIDRSGPFPLGPANSRWQAANMNPGWLHGVLLRTRPEYRTLLRERVEVLFAPDGPLGDDASMARWLGRKAQVEPLIDAEAARWGDASGTEYGRDDWLAEVAWVETVWFPTRTAIVQEQLEGDGLRVAGMGVGEGDYWPAERLGPAPSDG